MKFRSTSKHSASAACQEADELDGVTIKWLQYAGLQHLASPVASPDQRQLLHDLLLQRYGAQAIPSSENHEDSTAQCEPLNSSGNSSTNVSKKIGIGLLDLKSMHDDTNFLSEDLTTEPLDLLPSSPPKVVNRDFSSIVNGKSQVKSNNTIRAEIDHKKSGKNAKGKELHKSKEKATDIALAPEKDIGEYAKDEDMTVAEDMDVVALQFGSPVWSPMRGLYSELSLIEGAEYKRSTGKHDDDFAFIRDEESSRNPEYNTRSRRSLGKMETISKKLSPSMDNITLDNPAPVSPTTGLDTKFNSLMEDIYKLHSFRSDSAPKENNAQTTDKGVVSEIVNSSAALSPNEINKEFDSSIEELSKCQSTRKVRSSSAHRKEILSKEPNATKVRVSEIETEELDLPQLSFHHGSDSNALNSEIEEKSKGPSNSKSRPLHVKGGELNSKGINPTKNRIVEIKSKPYDSTHISSPRKSESRIGASSVRRKQTNSDKIRVEGEDNKSIRAKNPAKKESVVRSKSKEYNSKRVSTERTDINVKDNRITNIEPVKRASEHIHNSISIPREEATSTSGTDEKPKKKNAAKIRVVVRKRPLNKKEMLKKEKDILSVEDNERLIINAPKLKVDLTAYIEKHEFSFDAVLHEHVTDDEVYNVTVGPSIPTIFEQAITCFAFGYTGSGKTFTMGNLSLRASKDILQLLHKTSHTSRNLTLWVSYFEIHGKTIFDLLNERRKLCIREDGNQQVRIVGLQEYETSDIAAVKKVVSKGNGARSKGSTGINEESSRSHSILQLAIKQNPMFPAKVTKRKSTESGDLKAKGGKVIGKTSFIDLAGSERGTDYTHNDHDNRKGVEINKSLLALKECIRALDNEQNHIPFRGSKLTEVLRDSFIGDLRTVMICCVSPSAASCEQTLNSLRYAERVKNLCNKDGYSHKDQGASEILTDSNKMDRRVEKITRIGVKNSKLYNPSPELTENLSMRDIYNYTPTIGESSFQLMSGCSFSGSEDLEPRVEYKVQNNITNSYSTSYVSSLDFGSQNLQQIYGKEEQIIQPTDQAGLNIEKDIRALLEKERSRSSTFSRGKEYSNDREIVEKIPSIYESSDSHEQQNFSMTHAGPSNSLDVHQEEQVDIELLTEEIYEKESHSDLVSSGLPLQSNKEISWNHQNQEEFSSETSDIKTIFEVDNSSISDIDKEKEFNSFTENKEMLDTLSDSENNINKGPEGRPSLFETEKNGIHELDFRYSLLSVEEIFENQMEEEAVKEIGKNKNVVDVSLMARAKSIGRELLLPLHKECNDLQVISSNNPTKTRSVVSTQNSLNVSENKKAPNKSPNGRISKEEKNSKNLSKEELKSPLKNHEEQYMSGAKASEGLTIGKNTINLFEEEEALLAAHRKVIQSTMNILCEEMNLLVQVDQQGRLTSRYVEKLGFVLSRKAADLVSLQEHVMRFQQCLQD